MLIEALEKKLWIQGWGVQCSLVTLVSFLPCAHGPTFKDAHRKKKPEQGSCKEQLYRIQGELADGNLTSKIGPRFFEKK